MLNLVKNLIISYDFMISKLNISTYPLYNMLVIKTQESIRVSSIEKREVSFLINQIRFL